MIGEEVRRRRTELGLTGAQLAARADMAPSAVSQIETGKRTPSSTSVIKLADALGVEVADLFPKGQAPLPFEQPEGEASAERRKRFRDLASYAGKLYAMFVHLNETRPTRPTEKDLDRVEIELNAYATAFFNFLDTLNEEGTTREVVAYLAEESAGEPFVPEVRELHGYLRGTLTEQLPLYTDWLIEQSRRQSDGFEEESNVLAFRKRSDRYAEELQLDRLGA
jgi:transcriptional regulator with XRE-family HTH domain